MLRDHAPELWNFLQPRGPNCLCGGTDETERRLNWFGARFVELGAIDILGAVREGMLVSGVNVTPFAYWSNVYNQVLDRVGAVADEVLLVGLGSDISRLNALRLGSELWADRTAFLTAYNVAVSDNCEFSPHLVMVPIVVPTAVGTGLFLRSIGSPFPFTVSCAEGAANVIDRILTPS